MQRAILFGSKAKPPGTFKCNPQTGRLAHGISESTAAAFARVGNTGAPRWFNRARLNAEQARIDPKKTI